MAIYGANTMFPYKKETPKNDHPTPPQVTITPNPNYVESSVETNTESVIIDTEETPTENWKTKREKQKKKEDVKPNEPVGE